MSDLATCRINLRATVDAKHALAKAYDQRLGFIPCQDQTLTVHLPVATLQSAVLTQSASS